MNIFYRSRKPLLALALLVLGGCSSTTFVYNRLDFILPWYLDDYVELNRAQDVFLDEQLAPFLEWHRNEELPRYLDVIDGIDAVLEGPVSAGDIAAISLEFEQAWFRLEGRALDWLLALGDELSQEQVGEFLGELWKKQEKYEKKYLDRDDDEYREDSYESLVDSTQDFLGRLDSTQKQLLEDASVQLIRSDAIWLTERAQWLRRLEVFMKRDAGWQERVRYAVTNRSDTVSQEYLQVYDHNLQVIYAALAEVLNSRSDKQERRLRNRISELRKDLETLISQGQDRKAAKAA